MPAPTQTLGLDLGDRRSSVCLISAGGEILEQDEVATTKEALAVLFDRLEPSRIVIEACGHVHWVAKLANLISRSGRKNDRNDARVLTRLGRVDPELLRPITLRGEECRATRTLLQARAQLVRTRTKLVPRQGERASLARAAS